MTQDTFDRGVRVFRGTRDYFGDVARRRLQIISTIELTFKQFGFEPLITPAIENDRTLKGKYGEEGEANRYKLALVYPDEAGLRYDHTVPLARFLAMNGENLLKPYRRYAIGPVWRNENPSAGRLREFVQCDFDTAGSTSPVVDAEIAAIFNMVLNRLGFPPIWTIQINDRRLLNAMVQSIGVPEDKVIEIFRAWDKLEKSTLEEIAAELTKKKLSDEQVSRFTSLTEKLQQVPANKGLSSLNDIFGRSVTKPVEDLKNLCKYIEAMGVSSKSYKIVPTLARGLDYYTGPIFELVAEKGIGSIAGGGRFDNLVKALGGPDLPASGASFGLERLMTVLDQLKVETPTDGTDVFVTLWDPNNLPMTQATFKVANSLRLDGIKVEVYTGNAKTLAKQLEIANKKRIPLSLIIGPDEFSSGNAIIKKMETGSQAVCKISEVSNYFRN